MTDRRGPAWAKPALRGDLPRRCGWLIVGNDLVWWVPFAALLLAARRQALAR